jgi:hypothetical protein
VWQFKRKRDLRTGAIKKHKARLCLDGSKQTKGVDFWETYAPVATWNSIRVLLIMSLTLGWHTKQLDYVQAFPQAPRETQLYTKLPTEIHHDGCVSGTSHMMKVLRNVHGSKQAGRTFNKYLVTKLASIGFSQSRIVDPCVFYKGGMMYVLYTDDSILAGPDLREIEECIEEMKKANLDITVEGDLSDFLGVNIDRLPDGSYHLSQPKLIDSILEDLHLCGDNVVTKSTTMSSGKLLSRHPESASHDNSFHYRRAIGKLNFLEKSTRPDIAYAVHQCARFSVYPKVEHASAVRWIDRYLKGTRDKGFIIKPNSTGLEVFVDADFSGELGSRNCAPGQGHRAFETWMLRDVRRMPDRLGVAAPDGNCAQFNQVRAHRTQLCPPVRHSYDASHYRG